MLGSVLRNCCRRCQKHIVRPPARSYTSTDWSDLGLHPALVQKLADVGFEKPTPIQARAIPQLIAGKHVVCHAETGCGKTLCYLLPLLHSMLEGRTQQHLVFVPTPELGQQITNMFTHVRPTELGVVTPYLWEGVSEQRSFVDKTSPLIITTMSKLKDYDCHKVFGHIPTIVLDEADVYHTGRLKNLTFRIVGNLVDPLRYLKTTDRVPTPKQLIYVAATFNEKQKGGSGVNLRKWLRFHNIDPYYASTDNLHACPSSLETFWRYVPEEDLTREILEQLERVYCGDEEKEALEENVPKWYSQQEDLGIRKEPVKISIPEDMSEIVREVVNPDRKVLIFLNNADSVNVLYKNIIHYLNQSPEKSVQDLARRVYRLSGSLSREERAAVIKRVQRGTVRILVASDVVSRGLDIPNLDMVINAQLPVDTVGYLHRAGRTARMGRRGVVLNLLSDYDVPLYTRLSDVLSRKIPRIESAMVAEAVAAAATERSEKKEKQRAEPWLRERPARFVSKVFREDFEIGGKN